MPAKVVFADGSKAMAHNLDDLYERWIVRHQEVIEANPNADTLAELELFVPKLPKLETREEAEIFRAQLLEKLGFVDRKLQEFELQPRVTHYHERLQKLATQVAKERIQNQLGQVKAFIKVNNHHVNATNTRISEMRGKEAAGELSLKEQIELAEARFDEAQRHLDGLHKWAYKVENDDRIKRLEELLAELRKTLVSNQSKLIAAYERIIELQAIDE